MLSSISRYLFIYTLLILISAHTSWSAVAGGRGLWTILVSNEHHGEASHHVVNIPPPEEPRTRRVAGSGSSDQETMCHHTLVILLSYPCHGVIFPAQPSSAHPAPAHSHDDNHRNGSSVWTPVDILLTHSNQYRSRRGGRSIWESGGGAAAYLTVVWPPPTTSRGTPQHHAELGSDQIWN